MRPSHRCAALAAVALLSLGACKRERSHAAIRDRDTSTVAAVPLQPGDVVITTTDTAVDMGVIGDHIIMRLSPKTLGRVRNDLDTNKVEGEGFGASIERLVKKSVSAALAKQVEIPLSDVRDVRYENGRIEFDWRSKPAINPENTKNDGRDMLSSFSPADAQRFVDAVKARKKELGQD